MAFVTTTIDNTVNNDSKISGIVIGPDLKPHVCYYDDVNNNLKYAKFNGTVWTEADGTPGTETVGPSSNDVGYGASIDLDSQGYPWISYYDSDDDKVLIAQWNGSTWGLNEVFNNTGFGNSNTSIKIDKTIDKAWIAFGDTNSNRLRVSDGSGASWNSVIPDAGNAHNGGVCPLLEKQD